MECQVLTIFSKGVDSFIVPYVGPISSVLAEFKIVDVPSITNFPHKDQLVPGAIERAHAPIVLGPHAQLLKRPIDQAASGHDFHHMAPVHAHELDGAVTGKASKILEGREEKLHKLHLVHLARRLDELRMLYGAKAGDISDLEIVRRVGEYELGSLITHK